MWHRRTRSSTRSYENLKLKVCLLLCFVDLSSIHYNVILYLFNFFSKDRKFLIANAQVPHRPIIYCNDSFCDTIKYSRYEIMQKACTCDFLYGTLTSNASRAHLLQALSRTEESQVVILLYKKDGTTFLSNILIAPVKNENSEVILFILNFDELSELNDSRASHLPSINCIIIIIYFFFNSNIFQYSFFLFTQNLNRFLIAAYKSNRILRQIGMPFISTIFTRASHNFAKKDFYRRRSSDSNLEQAVGMTKTSKIEKISNLYL